VRGSGVELGEPCRRLRRADMGISTEAAPSQLTGRAKSLSAENLERAKGIEPSYAAWESS